MFAVPLARLGHDVTVVDPSADALATLRRRAETAGVGPLVRGIQGDGDQLHESVPSDGGGYDLALCHYVLEVVDDPGTTLREIVGAERSGGQVSGQTPSLACAFLPPPVAVPPAEALALVEPLAPPPGRSRPARRRF